MTPFSAILTARKLTLAQVAVRWGVARSDLAFWAAGTERLPMDWRESLDQILIGLERDPLTGPEVQAIDAWQVRSFISQDPPTTWQTTPLAVALSARGVALAELAPHWGQGVTPSACSKWTSGSRGLPPKWREHLDRALVQLGAAKLSVQESDAITAWQAKLYPRPRYRAL